MRETRPNHALHLTAGHCAVHIEFYETVLDVCYARRRQRWLRFVSLGLCNVRAQ